MLVCHVAILLVILRRSPAHGVGGSRSDAKGNRIKSNGNSCLIVCSDLLEQVQLLHGKLEWTADKGLAAASPVFLWTQSYASSHSYGSHKHTENDHSLSA